MSHDGRQLAVKVQHVGLRDTCAADTVIVEAFVKGLRWMFPDFNYQWLVDELKESVPKVVLTSHLTEIDQRKGCVATGTILSFSISHVSLMFLPSQWSMLFLPELQIYLSQGRTTALLATAPA